MIRKLAIPLLIAIGLLVSSGDSSRAAIQAGMTTRVSVASDGTQANGNSEMPALSADGRFVAFASYASNLVSEDTNNEVDIFLHDQQTGQTERVSISSAGAQANSSSWEPSLSADGRFIAFDSHASNLVSDDSYPGADVFLHDRLSGQTELISRSVSGAPVEGDSYRPSISADGRFVAFESYADNLVSMDTDYWNVYLRDRESGQTELISKTYNGAPQNSGSGQPFISPDGRFVAFMSAASNLVSGDANHNSDIFILDRQTGQMELVSVASDGTQGNDFSLSPSISVDGRFVAFASYASNLVSDDTNSVEDIFVHDRQTGQTRRVSLSSTGQQANSFSDSPVISAAGRFMAFASYAGNLVSGDTNHDWDIFVYDLQIGHIERVSLANDGAQGDGYGFDPALSAAGRFVAYVDSSSNRVQGDTNGWKDIFVFTNASDAFFERIVYLPLTFVP